MGSRYVHKYSRLVWRNEKVQKRDLSNSVLEFELLIHWGISRLHALSLMMM